MDPEPGFQDNIFSFLICADFGGVIVRIILKIVKYILGAFSLSLTLSIFHSALMEPLGMSIVERIASIMLVAAMIALVGGFFVKIAQRKNVFKNVIFAWLYVIFIPVVSWIDILCKPECDNSSRVWNFFKDVGKFAVYLWGIKFRAICLFATVVIVFVMPFSDESSGDLTMKIFPIIYAGFSVAAAFHFLRIATRKQCLIYDNAILTWLYIFFVPIVSWREIFLKPETDGSRVNAAISDIRATIKFFLIALIVAVVFLVIAMIAMREQSRMQNPLDVKGLATPACAGNIDPFILAAKPNEDHPRVCGEQPVFYYDIIIPPGSPPRVRGTYGGSLFNTFLLRITPACAGNIRCGLYHLTPGFPKSLNMLAL